MYSTFIENWDTYAKTKVREHPNHFLLIQNLGNICHYCEVVKEGASGKKKILQYL